jgi:hypothetical protein
VPGVADGVAEFNGYLDRGHADPVADLVGFWPVHRRTAERVIPGVKARGA